MHLCYLFIGALTCLPFVPLRAQPKIESAIEPTRIMGSIDRDVVIPDVLAKPLAGSSDAAALQVIAQYLKSANVNAWSGMQATGTLSSANSSSPTQSPIKLAVKDGSSFRLDVQAAEGDRSLRIDGKIGEIHESDGEKNILPRSTAMNGLLAFPRLFMPTFPGPQTTLRDRGLVTIEGESLRRITVTTAEVTNGNRPHANDIGVVDLYFDPASHLLVKSAQYVQLSYADRERYLQVMSYSNYQTVEGVQIPFQLSQTLNGQEQWTIALTEVKLQMALDKSYFHF